MRCRRPGDLQGLEVAGKALHLTIVVLLQVLLVSHLLRQHLRLELGHLLLHLGLHLGLQYYIRSIDCMYRCKTSERRTKRHLPVTATCSAAETLWGCRWSSWAWIEPGSAWELRTGRRRCGPCSSGRAASLVPTSVGGLCPGARRWGRRSSHSAGEPRWCTRRAWSRRSRWCTRRAHPAGCRRCPPLSLCPCEPGHTP
jgi:hypothetical protein